MYSYCCYVFFLLLLILIICYVFLLLLLILIVVTYSYFYVYVFLLCMFRSGYSVSLFCSVYCWCVNVYCTTTATCCQPNFS